MPLSRSEVEDLKPYVEKAVDRYVGSKDSSVISSAINCLSNGYDRKKTAEKLSSLLDSHKASKLADKIFSYVHDLHKSSHHSSSKKRHHQSSDRRESKDSKRRRTDDDSSTNRNSSSHLNSYQIKEMMVNAQRMIEERKRALTTLGVAFPTSSLPSDATEDDKARKIAELQAQIQSKLNKTGLASALNIRFPGLEMPTPPTAGTINALRMANKPTPLILDEKGRTVDMSGKEVQLTQRMPTLKANIRAIKREKFKALQAPPQEETLQNKYFDARVEFKVPLRSRRVFKFHEHGKFQLQGQKIRAKAQLEKLQSEIAQIAKKTGISSATKLALVAPKTKLAGEDYIPNVEWWDSVILRNKGDITDKYEIRYQGITNLVEHPAQLRCPTDPTRPPQIPAYLTKKEYKKLRRMNRREAWKEKQEKIRLGLDPPPEPKLRLSNLMRAIGTQAIQDPTKIEAHVREQMAKRQRAHEEANAARKLTVQERREKKIQKTKEDTTLGVNVAIYRIKNLTNPAKKFKVEKNAQQLFLTGTVVLYRDINVVVVEGGPKQQKKYRRLMMNRIKWADDNNECILVWEGTNKQRNFGEVKFKICPTESIARELFRKHKVEHYWDLAYSSAVLDQTEET